MTSPDRKVPPETTQPAPLWRRGLAAVLKGLIAVAIVATAAWIARDVMVSAPVAQKNERPRTARLVQVAAVEARTQGPVLEAWGEVVAARRLEVRPEVGGTVEALHPAMTPGGRIGAGEILFRIDPRTLELELAAAEAEIRGIESRILLEEGQHERARRDLERSPLELDERQRALVLREPQAEELAAERAAAIARRDAARVALSKSTVRAPFDAAVVSETLAEGGTVAANTTVAELVGSDRFRIELAVPVAALDWIDTSGGQRIRIVLRDGWQAGGTRTARIERLAPGLTETGRMAEVIATVEDPLGLDDPALPPLLLGSFVRAEIEGREVAGAVSLPRAWLRDGDSVWVMTPDDTLEIRPVEVAWKGAETVLIADGLEDGERVVITNLATVADGMRLRTGTAGQDPLAGAEGGAAGG